MILEDSSFFKSMNVMICICHDDCCVSLSSETSLSLLQTANITTGHVIPALTDDSYASLEGFLMEQQATAADASDSLPASVESSRL